MTMHYELECDDCGETFTDLALAYHHAHDPMIDARFTITEVLD